jgi:hypothetical protein
MLCGLSSKKRDGRRSALVKGGFVASITSAAIASGVVRLMLPRLRMATNPTTATTQIVDNQNRLSIWVSVVVRTSIRVQEISDREFDLVGGNEMPLFDYGNDTVYRALIDDLTRFNSRFGNR